MAATTTAWSPVCILSGSSSSSTEDQQQQRQQQQPQDLAERVALLAVGSKAGCVQLWRYNQPLQYGSTTAGNNRPAAEDVQAAADAAGAVQSQGLQYLGAVHIASGAYVTSLAWVVLPAAAAGVPSEGGAAAASGSSSCAVLPGSIVRQAAGDVLLLAVGELLHCSGA